MVTPINSGSVYTDSITYFRDLLLGNITDPISGTRPTNSKFAMTSFPTRKAVYPLIIVQDGNMSDRRAGIQSETSVMTQEVIFTVEARNVKERDSLSQQIYNFMRTNQYGTGSETTNFGFHDYKLLSSINITKPNEEGRESGVRTKQMIYQFFTLID